METVNITLAYDSYKDEKYFCGPISTHPWPRSTICLGDHCTAVDGDISVSRITTQNAIDSGKPFAYIVSWRYYIGYDLDYSREDLVDAMINRLQWITDLPVLHSIRSGHCMLVFDDSYEGFQFTEKSKNLHRLFFPALCKFLHINESQIIFVDGNYIMPLNNNLSKTKFIYENRFEQTIFTFANSHNLFNSVAQTLPIVKDYIFLSYARHWNEARQFFTFELFAKKLNKYGIISCSNSFNSDTVQYSAENFLRDMNHKWDRNYTDISEVDTFLKKLPIILDSDLVENLAININLQHYTDSYISIIHETHTHNDSVFISEKTFKTILAGHPFIIMGSPHMLSLLKTLGYKTFHPYIDESYDAESNLTSRKDMVIREIEKIINMNENDRHDLFLAISEITKFNFHHLQNYHKRNSVGYNTLLTILEHQKSYDI